MTRKLKRKFDQMNDQVINEQTILTNDQTNPIITNDQIDQTPQTFDFTQEQFKEMHDILDKGEQLPQEMSNKLDKNVKQMLGEENYANFSNDLEKIQEDSMKELQSILENMDDFL
uniref:Uncharacterized protein n=1 Tax=Russula subnigricans TaxID=258989 RepID=A0A649WI04_9AGAM|nr:hypothetical protein [Russula subnigricans]QGK88092.1 hypothetical protein [Russula subnigricans]